MKTHVYEGSLDRCLKCYQSKSDPSHIMNGVVVNLFDGNGNHITHTCPGHSCPKCNTVWEHDYDCGRDKTRSGLCTNCAQQNAAEINRPSHIAEIAKKQTGIMGAMESKEYSIQREEFIVMNIIKDNPNWISDLSKFIHDYELIIEKARISLFAAHKVRSATETAMLNKLTAEEQEKYRRDSTKPGKKSGATAPAKKAATKAETTEERVAKMTLLKMKEHPNWSREKAERMAKLMFMDLEDDV